MNVQHYKVENFKVKLTVLFLRLAIILTTLLCVLLCNDVIMKMFSNTFKINLVEKLIF